MGRSKPAISTRVSRRASVSRGLLAWTVVSEPSWPVFMAWSMSRASPERHSPTTMRSGRMRRQFLTRSRMVTSPRPSMLGGRASSESTWSWWSWSSLASSTVTMRSSEGMNDDSTLRVVVLPVPVPPETMMLRRPTTQACRKRAAWALSVPNRIRSSTCSFSVENFRMVRKGPPMASGWITALTREPSGRRASQRGLASSMRRPISLTILSMMRRRWVSSTNVAVDFSSRPDALDVDRVGAVAHDLGDLLVVEEPVDRAVAEDVVGDVLDELGLVGGRQRGPLLGQGGVELVVDPATQVVLGEPLVVEDRTQLVDEVVVDLLAELVEHRVASLAPGGGRRLHIMKALVERHCVSSLVVRRVRRGWVGPSVVSACRPRRARRGRPAG